MKINELLLLCLLLLLAGCKKNEVKTTLPFTSTNATDYTNLNNWMELDLAGTMDVDVFYVYPTVFNSEDTLNMDLNSDVLRHKADVATMKQIGVYSDSCNLFIPYYQQMSMVGLTDTTLNTDSLLDVALTDVKNAFAYYLRQSNKPFILAGHSQGSEMLLNLMKDSSFATDISQRLVAAYLIGYTVTMADIHSFPAGVHLATSEDDLKAVVTYNTQGAPDCDSPVLLEGALCVNPLLWTSSDSIAGKELNIKAVFFDDEGHYDYAVEHLTGAQIDLTTGALVATESSLDTYDTGSFPSGVYHKYDYSFFYTNLKQNVKTRVSKALMR